MSTKAYLLDPARGNSTLVRPRYSAGLLLQDNDLTAGVDYTRNLSRLLFRSFFGCGVVCGLTVSVKEDCGDKTIITIAEGVALACSGDPIQVPRPVSVTLDPCSGKKIPDKLWVTLCLTDRCCAPRTSMCACDDHTANVSTREIAGYEIRVLDQPDDCACGCPEKPIKALQNQVTVTTPLGSPRLGTGGHLDQPAAVADPADKGLLHGDAQVQPTATVTVDATAGCACADPCSPCYKDHYAGMCGCTCCDSDCVMLAVLARSGDHKSWTVNHSVRRFIRPVLMRDPQVVLDNGGTLCPASSPTPSPATPITPPVIA